MCNYIYFPQFHDKRKSECSCRKKLIPDADIVTNNANYERYTMLRFEIIIQETVTWLTQREFSALNEDAIAVKILRNMQGSEIIFCWVK